VAFPDALRQREERDREGIERELRGQGEGKARDAGAPRADVSDGVVLPLSIPTGGVLTLALVFESFVAGHRANGVFRCSLDALSGSRRFFRNRIIVAACVRIVGTIVIHVTHQ
jgi:hypothetical protein